MTDPVDPAIDPAAPPADAPATDPAPTDAPTQPPSPAATDAPTAAPTAAPSPAPTEVPTSAPTEPPSKAPDWPEDWRDKMAAGDEKLRQRLERFASPIDILKAYRALESKQGELVKPLPDNPTAEELSAWRKSNGIPDKPEDYDTTLDGGVVIGEQDKPLVGQFLAAMHEKNAKPEHVKAALATYFKLVEGQQADWAKQDAEFKDQAEEELRGEWGTEYKLNDNIGNNFLALAPAELRERFLNGRTADGRLIKHDPGVRRWMAQMGRELNPVATVVPGSGANAAATINDEIAKYEKQMRTDWHGWHKDEASQARYRDLLTAKEKLAARGG